MVRVLCLALGLAALWPGCAAAQPASYSIRRLVVEGGSPMHGVDGGVIFERHPEEDCRLPAILKVKPLAAALGDGVSLHVEIGACPESAPPPPSVECRLGIGDQVFPARIEGGRGTIPVPVPAHVMNHTFNLQCDFPGGDEELSTAFYVTYARPLEVVSPPREDWYLLACDVGAGLTAERTESEALDLILRGLYDVGQRLWRYGYCTMQLGARGCHFGATSVPRISPSLNILSPTLATCKWSALVENAPLCNFTDCFGFSRIFQYIAATMGIGGLENQEVKGNRGKGFGTQGWLRSLDPAALGNLECGERSLQCAFLFSVHDLRRRDGLSYDSTFGRIYHDMGELVAANILSVQGSYIVILDRANACFVQGQPYGAFSPLREIPKAMFGCPLATGRPGGPAAALAGATVTLESIAGDARPELVRADLTLEVREPGSYTVTGILSTEAGEAIARPSYEATAVWSQAEVAGPGTHEVSLFFSGEDLADEGDAGPYRLHVALTSQEGIVAELHQDLPPFVKPGLGERAARLGEISLHPGQDGVLRVEVPVKVRDAGLFDVEARLSSGDRTLVYRGLRRELPEGPHRLTIDFPGEKVTGIYAVTVNLHLLDPVTQVPLKPLDSARVESGSGRGAVRPPA